MQFIDLGEPPAPGPTEVLIRTKYSGLTNGTERHALLGEHGWTHYPARSGYQHVGVIEATGEAVTGFAPGDWVFFGRYVGHRAWNVVDVAHTDWQSNHSHLCLKLPEGVSLEDCALLGVAGVALRHVHRCRVGLGQRVWVAGLGVIGQFAAQAARLAGAHVTVTDINAERLAVAEQCGAHQALNATDPGFEEALRAGGPYDVIMDACGVPSLLLDIHRLGLVPHGGVIGCVAVRSETTFHWAMLHGPEASIEVSCHFSLSDLAAVLQGVQLGTLRLAPVISHRVPLEAAPALYATLREEPAKLRGVVFQW